MTRFEEIEKRMKAIKAEIDVDGADLDALEKEINELKDEKRILTEKVEKRKALIDEVSKDETAPIIKNFKEEIREERTLEFTKDNVLETKEYRSAFLKNLQKRELTEIEQRALTTASNSVGAALPTETQNEIITKLKEYSPMMNEITLLQVEGNVKFAVENTVNDAALHTEGATITASADALVTVSLAGYEVTKLITVSKSVATMSINAFETWLVDMLVEGIANKINGFLISGTGSSQPTGIDYAQTWDTTNSVTVGVSSSLTAANVQKLCSLLNGGYDADAKFYMSKKTLFNDFLVLQDNSKHALVSREGANYLVYGYPVILDSRVTEHEAYLGNLKKAVVGNLAESVTVTSDFDVKTNSFDFLGCAIFDSKIAVGEAIVKLVKATE